MAHDAATIAWVIRLGLSLVALLLAYRLMLRQTLIETFRQDVFQLRREMFLLVVHKKIEPTHPAYTRLRMTMNGAISLAETITLDRLLAWMVFFEPPPADLDIDALIDTVEDAEARDGLRKAHRGLGRTIFAHLLMSTPVMWPVLGIAVLVVLAKSTAGRIAGRIDVGADPEGLADAALGHKHRRFILASVEAEAEDEGRHAHAAHAC